MAFATTRTITLSGAVGHLIHVQADVSQGMVSTVLVGRPDASINEGRDRIRMAIHNSSLEWPTTRRVTILLSPTDLKKSGPHFDLAMAISVLGATNAVPVSSLPRTLFIGELTLDGRLRPVPGVLPMALAAMATGEIDRVFVPESQATEASMVPGLEVFGVRSLAQVVAELNGEEIPEAEPVAAPTGTKLLAWRGEDRIAELDMRDVIGMADARFAMEVAAAGGHHLMLSGAKGSGKTTLAERLPGILPDLCLEESLELMAIQSLAGTLDPAAEFVVRPPYVAPHSSSSRASLLGGGSGKVRPGEISRAHTGVVFLDEFPLFNNDIVEALRQPLESGEITIGRGDETVTYPARGMFVFAANPCPCGNYTADTAGALCSCSEQHRRAYRQKLAGPVLDRVDITRHIHPLKHQAPDPTEPPPESSAVLRARIAKARARQWERYADHSWRTNAQAPGPQLRQLWPLTDPALGRLDRHVYAGRLTGRGATRVHRLAWTVADLWGTTQPDVAELDLALRLRLGDPLPVRAIARRSA